ncbi:hypothetical protein ED208_16475 [Stagnimonas aquatica]|uniref:Uncharacterized protein n=1 Tax=Stagnimonas aquatica TaxID=2689987 RepID=A0A3N0UZP5_9GAMM|nr:hypothetical protein [Stagnimonas aquatica]ROH86017.1 hypothetical protein ED208_16475 [Stagnimonas aquatica]
MTVAPQWLKLGTALLLVSSAALAQHYPSPPQDSNTVYLEQSTPAGAVPPPRPVKPIVSPAPAASVAAPPSQAAVVPAPAAEFDLARRDFEQAYRRAGSPRMAVYFNRELSDEVREWIPDDAVTQVSSYHETHNQSASGSGEFKLRGQGELKPTAGGKDPAQPFSLQASGQGSSRAQAQSETRAESTNTVLRQAYIGPTGGREDPREAWKWEFEDSLTNKLLSARANLVDRAMIFRLMAKNSPQSDGLSGSISTNINEISALEKYADILVEMLVTEAPGTAVGYDFRATAKEVKTGRLLGTAYVRGSESLQVPQSRIVAGANGYQRETIRQVPTVNDVSGLLATRLLRSMAGAL